MERTIATIGTLEMLRSEGLLQDREREAVLALLGCGDAAGDRAVAAGDACGASAAEAAARAVRLAETVHLHIKVDDTHALPLNAFFAAGAQLDHQKDGFAKFRLPGGLNAIFSHIAVAQEDLHETPGTRRPRPFLDHIGIDLRAETAPVRAAFDDLPATARKAGWQHVAQGGGGTPVACCHVEVAAKHWLYPPRDGGFAGIPLEFAYGALTVIPGQSGCDLRPADPRLGLAPAACAPADRGDPAAGSGGGYFQPADLRRFGEISRVNPQLGNAFFAYYGMVMQDGVLSKREKALAALAVAHAQKCPYCIDAYTTTLHGLGATEAEMSEIVHVAAAMVAGITLVHSVQMLSKLDRLRGSGPADGCC